jgi:hypothetical protein
MKKSRKPIAKLEPDELEQLINNERVMDDFRHAYMLMVKGQEILWWSLRQKYNLPEEIDFNRVTGEIFPKSKPNG